MKNPFAVPDKPSALPIKGFTKDPKEYCWEDWKVDAKRKYPIRFFLSEELPVKFHRKVTRPIQEAIYFLKTNLVPSKRYHKLDLRHPQDLPEYKYGWLDSNLKMFHALMRILVDFIEKEHGGLGKYYEWVKFQNDRCDGSNPTHSDLLEIGAIYEWFKFKRKKDLAAFDAAMSDWYANRKNGNRVGFEELNKLEQTNKDKDTKMLCRLIELRDYMWT